MCYDCNTFIPFICCYKTDNYVTEDYKSTIDKREDPEAKKIKHNSGVPGHLNLGVPDLFIGYARSQDLLDRESVYANYHICEVQKELDICFVSIECTRKVSFNFFLSKCPRQWKVKRCSL